MRFETYDYITGERLSSQAAEIDLGDIIQGQHSPQPVVIRAVSDTTAAVSNLVLYLQSSGGWNVSEFGYYINSTFVPGVESGSSQMQNRFQSAGAPPGYDSTGVPVGWSSGKSHYIWLDAQIPSDQTGVADVNFRLTYV